jgi:hypothetical protein
MKKALGLAISLALCTTSAFADSSALKPGRPAGVREAQTWDLNTTMIISAAALAGLGFGLAASTSGGGPTTSTSGSSTTTSTSTTS